MPEAPTLTLATAASERKERLLALKKRKAGDADGLDENTSSVSIGFRTPESGLRQGKAIGNIHVLDVLVGLSRRGKVALRQRNFDPVTRQPTQRTAAATTGQEQDQAGELDTTVEKRMAGVAEQIVREDEAKRTQELVSVLVFESRQFLRMIAEDIPTIVYTGFTQHPAQES
jgi:hypothetical protein